LLESVGAFEPATRAIEEAVARQPTDASLWVVASRIAIEADRPRLALAEWRRARSLDPTWPIFAR
jgi:predicted Zn-dependent protease